MPEHAVNDASCRDFPEPPAPVPVVVPGDNCTVSAECVGDPAFVSCTDERCVTTVKIGDSCPAPETEGDEPGHQHCPIGSYCGESEQPGEYVCKNTTARKGECNGSYQCGFGLLCVSATAPYTTSYCTSMYTFTVGTIIDIKYVSRANARVVTPNDLCRSHHIRDVEGPEGTDRIQCITPDKSLDQDEDLLIRYQGAGLD